MTYTVYAIKSLEHEYVYVGLSSNVKRKISEHNNGRDRTTRYYAPFRLIYSEPCPDRVTARGREKYLKSSAGRRFLKQFY